MASNSHGFLQPEILGEKFLGHVADFEDHDSSSTLLPSIEESGRRLRERHTQRRLVLISIGQLAFFVLFLSMLVYSLHLQKQMPRNCLRKISSPSPLLDAFTDDDYEWVHWNTTLNTFGEFTGKYTEEKARAWESLTSTPLVTVSEANMISAGAALDSVRVPQSAGGGYLAQFEGYHALHCLRALWFDHHSEEIPEIKKSKLENLRHYEAHYEHCVDLLRQSLTCHFDTSITTFNWLVDIGEPFPYFSNPKKCLKLDKIVNWTHEHKLHMPGGFVWKAPDDAHLVRVVDRVAQWDEPRVDKYGNVL
ncbi:hypothetical protein GGR57DRAFT_518217 [Xylariaceae sp. FL1272]|nr:hypothetical protein GGR57DRAFT_518217 [Xylariaceae sp. FL1272]